MPVVSYTDPSWFIRVSAGLAGGPTVLKLVGLVKEHWCTL